MPTLAQLDPSRTSGLRRRFEAQMAKRLRDLLRLIRQSIVDNDCFGIQPVTSTLQRALAAATPRQFAFERDTAAKVQAFLRWLKEQEALGILQVIFRPGTNTAISVGWTDLYIQAAYRQGIGRAQTEMLRAQLILPFPGDLPGRTAVSTAFNLPIHADRVGALYTRTFEDLKTVMDVVNTDIRRKLIDGLTTNLTRGIAEGKNPITIAREMVKDVASGLDKIGLNRARMIARTEVIRAHHLASINEYRRADAAMTVAVQAEFRTAGDDRVCPECSALEGKVFSLDEAESVIPVHVQCRCVMLPHIARNRATDNIRQLARVA